MNPYEVFGLSRHASEDEIRKTYRRLSLECHPDKPHGDKVKFQQLTEAYEALTRKDVVPKERLETLLETFLSTPIVVPVTLSMYQSYTGCKLPITLDRWEMQRRVRETVYVDMPPGIDTNEHIMLDRTPPVCVSVTVANETNLVRKGLDVWCVHTITLKEAFCGFTFDFAYPDRERARIKTPRGTIIPPGYKKIIPGRGMKRDGQVGEFVLEFTVSFPTTATAAMLESMDHHF